MEISIKRLPGALTREYEETRKNIARGLRDGARIGKVVLKRRTKKDRGMAQMGWQNHDGPINARGETPAAWVDNSTPYIGILENGARPHPVSKEGQEAIYQWVLRNMRLVGGARQGFAAVHGNELNEGQRRQKFQSVDKGEQLAREITFLICRKIREKGQAPTFFVKNAQDELTRIAQEQVEKHIREGAKGKQS